MRSLSGRIRKSVSVLLRLSLSRCAGRWLRSMMLATAVVAVAARHSALSKRLEGKEGTLREGGKCCCLYRRLVATARLDQQYAYSSAGGCRSFPSFLSFGRPTKLASSSRAIRPMCAAQGRELVHKNPKPILRRSMVRPRLKGAIRCKANIAITAGLL